MKNLLLEKFQKRLAVSEAVYAEKNKGAKLSESRKMLIATMLNNTSKFITESMSNSVGTQRSDLGEFKRFCLNLVNVALPNLIAPELVIVHPMTSITGVITYIQYTAGSNKGETKRGDVFNDPFHLGTSRDGESISLDTRYTGAAVVEMVKAGADGSATLAWFPLSSDVAPEIVGGASGQSISVVDAASGKVMLSGVAEGEEVKVKYVYDNVVIPQNDLPILNAQMKSIGLTAKFRRIAVYYSQIAAFQAKTDYGFDLGDQLAEKAVGQLSYEIDTEVTDLLISLAGDADSRLRFNETVPTGVSMAEHFESFVRTIEKGKQIIYDRTKRFAPNYMLCASDVATILPFIKGWKAASASEVNGPYFAGTLNGLKVFVTPNIAAHKFILGVNGKDMMSSAAVYAPYMPIVPTQLLGYADGGMSQGFSTGYALEPLNSLLVVAGEIFAGDQVVKTESVNA